MKVKLHLLNKIKSSQDRFYQLDRPIIAITGGIGTGKSSVTKILRDKKIKVICADELVKKIYRLDQTLNWFRKELPNYIQTSSIDFKKLKNDFFSDPKLQTKVEQYIYSNLESAFKDEVVKTPQDFILYDIPLLFEKKLENRFDYIICVYSPVETQIKRIIQRDNIDIELAKKIIEKQISIEFKKNKADLIISNTQDLDFLNLEVDKLIATIFS